MKKTIAAVVCLLRCLCLAISEDTIDDAFNDFFKIEDNSIERRVNCHEEPWTTGQSSWLKETGKPDTYYSREKAFDGKTKLPG